MLSATAVIATRNKFLDFLLRPQDNFTLTRYVFIAFIVTWVTTIIFSAGAVAVRDGFGVDIGWLFDRSGAIELRFDFENFLWSVLIAPIVETLLLALTANFFFLFMSSPLLVAAANGLIWGTLHKAFGSWLSARV